MGTLGVLALGPGRRSEFFDPKVRAKPAPVLESSERKVRTPQGRMPHELHRKCGRRASRRVDGQCHRKQVALLRSAKAELRRVIVKRWSKSPPRRRRRRRHEKPLPVQGKIGGWAARPIATGMPHPPMLLRSCGGQARRKVGLREMTIEAPTCRGRTESGLLAPKLKFFVEPRGAGYSVSGSGSPGSALMMVFWASYSAAVSSR